MSDMGGTLMGGKKEVGFPQGSGNKECGENLNKMAWAPNTLQGVEGAVAVGKKVLGRKQRSAP